MKLPRFSRNNASEPPSANIPHAPEPASKPDASAPAYDSPDSFAQPSEPPAETLPFDGVPPPPPPAPAPEPAQAPSSQFSSAAPSGDASAKKARFPRFLKSRKNASAPAESPPVPSMEPYAPPPLDAPSAPPAPPAYDANPPAPPPEASHDQRPVDPRAAEREEERRKMRLIELRTGVSMGIEASDGESTDDEARRRNEEEDGRHTGEDEGKPLEDAVVDSVVDPPPAPSYSTATQSTHSTAFNSAADAFRRGPSIPSAPHFIDTSYIDGAPLPGPASPHSSFPSHGYAANSVSSTSFQPSTPYQDSSPFFPSASGHQEQSAPPHPPQNRAAEMAEMFASRAFGNSVHSSPFPAQPAPLAPPPPPPPMSATGPPEHPGHPGEDALMKRSNSMRRPAPIGWGSIVDTTPSRPVYGHPFHLSQTISSPSDLDPGIADKIKRGRELAMLAVQQEEKGNLGAAEAGYIKALSLLVPASKDLDIGSDLTKNFRKAQKAKIQREAAAMLDRCDELRRFIKANGAAVPNELPRLPGELPKTKPPPPSRDSKPKDEGQADSKKGGRMLPPPPPPMTDTGDDDLLSRIANRQNVLPDATSELLGPSAPSTEKRVSDEHNSSKTSFNSTKAPTESSSQPAAPPKENEKPPKYDLSQSSFKPSDSAPEDHDTRHRGLSTSFRNLTMSSRSSPTTNNNASPRNVQDGSGAREGGSIADVCFLCRRPADLRSKCNHTFCSNCGNQVVSVFGRCPVPGCNEGITLDDFDHILR